MPEMLVIFLSVILSAISLTVILMMMISYENFQLKMKDNIIIFSILIALNIPFITIWMSLKPEWEIYNDYPIMRIDDSYYAMIKDKKLININREFARNIDNKDNYFLRVLVSEGRKERGLIKWDARFKYELMEK